MDLTSADEAVGAVVAFNPLEKKQRLNSNLDEMNLFLLLAEGQHP